MEMTYKLEELAELCSAKLPKVDLDLIEKAYRFAFIAHEKDMRASGEPYFTHPYAVAKILAEEIPFDDISVACGLLHDVVEDNDEYDIDTMKENFGEDIAIIVDGLTKIKELFKGTEINQAENYRKLLMSVTKDIRVIIVKFADRLHNMRELHFLNPDKRKRIAKETLEIYAPLAHRFGLGKIKWELEDLAFKELNKNAYLDIKKKINSKRPEREAYIKNFKQPIIDRIKEYDLPYEISGRPKHLYSIYRKMIKQNKPFEEIYDLFAVRIIIETNDVNDCYKVFGIINGTYIPVPDRFKDYIAIPKANNYQSIHTTVIGPEGVMVEVQIRNRRMHEIAERGVAAHWKYKEGQETNDDKINEYVSWIREILDSSGKEDIRKNIIENFKLNLYSDEVYVFTPKGDLKRLPIGSTSVDFAFSIHSNVGHHCIGAKVNKKIVPLDYQLSRGDQVEIITSKNQHPNKNWLKFVKTHKAKSAIKKWLNQEEEKQVQTGKEILEKKVKKLKIPFTEQDAVKLSRNLKFDNMRQFYLAISMSKFNLDEALQEKDEQADKNKGAAPLEFDDFAKVARGASGDLIIDGEQLDLQITYSKCCNPIPGDPVVGFVTTGEGIRIHRKNCRNMIEIANNHPDKIVPVRWSQDDDATFLVGLKVRGEDSAGILNDIANAIVGYNKTNIKSINIDTDESLFEGTVTLYVADLDHLQRIIDRLKKLKGVLSVSRLVNQ